MKIYYAHHLWEYGTEIEKYEISVISKTFQNVKIINPVTDVTQPGMYINTEEACHVTEADTMRYCLERITYVDALVFSAVSGIVGKGIYDEVEKAQELNKPVYFVWGNMLIPFSGSLEIISNSTSKRVFAFVRI